MDPPSSLGYVALSMGPVYFYTNNDTGYTTISGPVGTRIVLYDLDPNATQSDVTYVRGLNLIASVKDGQATYYHYNAHGDVVQLTDSTGALVKNYEYDAFGVEENAAEDDANLFRYCGEQYDAETGNYYLRARYYTPGMGRFTQADTHWNAQNMIYGDNPQKWNEYRGEDDLLGLHTYTYKPEFTAVAQAGNSYSYATNNPVTYRDYTGEIAVLTCIIIGVLVGAAVGGAAGAGVSYYKYKEIRLEYVVTGALAGAAVGGTVGWAASSYAAAAGISGATTVVSSLNVPNYVKDGGSLISWTQQTFEKTQQVLSLNQVKELFALANQYGVNVIADLEGHVGTNWPMAHIHLGNHKSHIAIAGDAVRWIMEQMG